MTETKRILTEQWLNKNYEPLLTEDFRHAKDVIAKARISPTIEYIIVAHAAVVAIVDNLLLSQHYLEAEKRLILPKLDEIGQLLHADFRMPSVQVLCRRYNTMISMKRNKREISNGIAIVNMLSEVFRVLRQFAGNQGFFVTKPQDRKYGLEALEDVMGQ